MEKIRLYLAKPYGKSEDFFEYEKDFLKEINARTPELEYMSVTDGSAIEYLPRGFVQDCKGIEFEYIFPLEDKIISDEYIDFGIPVVQPFALAPYMSSLSLFDRVFFPDRYYAENHTAYPKERMFLFDEGSRKTLTHHIRVGGRRRDFDDFEFLEKFLHAMKTKDYSGFR